MVSKLGQVWAERYALIWGVCRICEFIRNRIREGTLNLQKSAEAIEIGRAEPKEEREMMRSSNGQRKQPLHTKTHSIR